MRALEIVFAAHSRYLEAHMDFLHTRPQCEGFDRHEVPRLASRDRHVFSALMLQNGHCDVQSLFNPVFDAKASDGAVGVMAQCPFCCLSGSANILVVPARHSASISVKLMHEMAGAMVIGPILNMAVMAACKVGYRSHSATATRRCNSGMAFGWFR